MPRALVSVSDKTGLVEFAQGLQQLGFEILSTGGTRLHLEESGLRVLDVTDYTGFPEIMGGRVKTLHPKVHGGILGRPDQDAEAIKQHGIVPFDLVVCNLYPFEQTIAKAGVTVPEAIEQIDIGGPSMIRSAAKNHAYLGVVTRPSQYDMVLRGLQDGGLSGTLRRELARAAFEMTARYDAAIAAYFQALDEDEHPQTLTLSFERAIPLRYGENPHQAAAFYCEPAPPPGSLAAATQLHGKELSYNNLLDLDAALRVVQDFDSPAVCVIKHTNPCGCATAASIAEAFEKAYAGDPVSAFGSILGFNHPLDAATAEKLSEPGYFIEAIIAPGYDEKALQILRERPKWRNNVRLMELPSLRERQAKALDLRRVTGGLLVQQQDIQSDDPGGWQTVTDRAPTPEERADLEFGWTVCKHVKSNAIVFARGGMLVGVGAGQMSRLDSSFIAARKAGERSRGAVVASDAFFPFRDGVDEAARAGVRAIIQPGGSRNDEEVVAACNEHGIAMLFTGRRHFRH